MRDWPAIIQRVFVGNAALPLVAGDLRLEVVVVGLLSQLGHDLYPSGLGDEEPIGVIGPAGILDLAAPSRSGNRAFRASGWPRTRARTMIRPGSTGWPCLPLPWRAQTALKKPCLVKSHMRRSFRGCRRARSSRLALPEARQLYSLITQCVLRCQHLRCWEEQGVLHAVALGRSLLFAGGHRGWPFWKGGRAAHQPTRSPLPTHRGWGSQPAPR